MIQQFWLSMSQYEYSLRQYASTMTTTNEAMSFPWLLDKKKTLGVSPMHIGCSTYCN